MGNRCRHHQPSSKLGKTLLGSRNTHGGDSNLMAFWDDSDHRTIHLNIWLTLAPHFQTWAMVQIKNWRNHASIALDDATRQDAQITQIFWSHPPPIPADTHALTFLCSFFLKKPWEKHSGLGTAPTTSYFDPKHWCNFHNPQSNLWNIDCMWPLSLSLYIILYYFILYYVVWCCIILYCIILYYIS